MNEFTKSEVSSTPTIFGSQACDSGNVDMHILNYGDPEQNIANRMLKNATMIYIGNARRGIPGKSDQIFPLAMAHWRDETTVGKGLLESKLTIHEELKQEKESWENYPNIIAKNKIWNLRTNMMDTTSTPLFGDPTLKVVYKPE